MNISKEVFQQKKQALLWFEGRQGKQRLSQNEIAKQLGISVDQLRAIRKAETYEEYHESTISRIEREKAKRGWK